MTKVIDHHTKWMNDPDYAAAYEAVADEYSPQPINHPDPDRPEPIDIPDPVIHFPGMPHSIHGALWKVLDYAGSLPAACALLAEYDAMISRK